MTGHTIRPFYFLTRLHPDVPVLRGGFLRFYVLSAACFAYKQRASNSHGYAGFDRRHAFPGSGFRPWRAPHPSAGFPPFESFLPDSCPSRAFAPSWAPCPLRARPRTSCPSRAPCTSRVLGPSQDHCPSRRPALVSFERFAPCSQTLYTFVFERFVPCSQTP